MGGILYIVSTPIGHVEDLTLRAIRVLKQVAVIAAEDPQQTKILCERYDIPTPLTSYHNENKEEKAAVLLARLRGGESVALVVDAGTPVVADPGGFLIQEAIRLGVHVTVAPGPSALLAAVVLSGLGSDQFLFQGILPRRSSALRRLLRAVEAQPHTLVFLLESSGQLREALHAIREVLGDRPVVVAKNLTMPDEDCIRGKASEVAERIEFPAIHGTITLVVEGRRGRSKIRRKREGQIRRLRASGS